MRRRVYDPFGKFPPDCHFPPTAAASPVARRQAKPGLQLYDGALEKQARVSSLPIVQELCMNMLYRTFTEGESAPRFTLSLLSLSLLLGSAMPAAYAAKTELPATAVTADETGTWQADNASVGGFEAAPLLDFAELGQQLQDQWPHHHRRAEHWPGKQAAGRAAQGPFRPAKRRLRARRRGQLRDQAGRRCAFCYRVYRRSR